MRTRRHRTPVKGRLADPVVIALGLGSNLGDSEAALSLAVRSLLDLQLLDPLLSSPYSTRALCDPVQPRFLNAVLVASCRLGPEEVMGVSKGLEWLAGRRLGPRNAPRPLDVDLLVFGDKVIRRPEITLPHPRLRQRMFALAPLAEIAPDLPIPPDGARVVELLQALDPDQDVVKSKWTTHPI